MILYGRNLSPFVRRVAIWCALQGRAVESRPLAATEASDAESIRKVHPGLRVPALQLADGTVLIETSAITDWLDETAADANGVRLVPPAGLPRRDCLQRIGLAHSTTEKIVALVYEKNRRPEAFQWPAWQERLAGQVRGGLAAMDVAAPASGFHGGAELDGSDIATVCAYQMAEVTNPWLLESGYPALAGLAERAMKVPAVAETHPA